MLAFLFVGWSYVHYWTFSPQHVDYAIIYVAGQELRRVSLNSAQEIHVQGALGESVIEIAEGKIRFVQSACQGKYCVHTGWLTNAGDFSACVPNQVSIAVFGKRQTGVDAITY